MSRPKLKRPLLLLRKPSKICTKCGVEKPISKFRKRAPNSNRLRCWCKTCTARYDTSRENTVDGKEKRKGFRKKWKMSEKGKHSARKWDIKHNYGITLEQYDNILEKQNGVCAICKCPETYKLNEIVRRLSVDHDHETGKVRGLLCVKCNSILGMVQDSKILLSETIIYLDKNEHN